MGTYQFINVQGCALHASGQSRKRSISENLEEELRRAWACRHVMNPMPPVIAGDPRRAIAIVRAGATSQRDRAGRRQRRDTPVMVSIVASYPSRIADMRPGEWSIYSKWRNETLAWLKRRFRELGAVFGYAVQHLDENYPHIHVHFHNAGASIKSCHPGYMTGKKYKAAMEKFQREYHGEVTAKYGMDRRSVRPRKRISRKAHLAGVRVFKDTAPQASRNSSRPLEERNRPRLRPAPTLDMATQSLPARKDRDDDRRGLEVDLLTSPLPIAMPKEDCVEDGTPAIDNRELRHFARSHEGAQFKSVIPGKALQEEALPDQWHEPDVDPPRSRRRLR